MLATGCWIAVAVCVCWLVYRARGRSKSALVAGLALGVTSLWLLTDSRVERALWVHTWPKSRSESVLANCAAVLWESPRYNHASPKEIVATMDLAITAAMRRLPAGRLRNIIEFWIWLGGSQDEGLCMSIGQGAFLERAVERAPESVFAKYRQFMIDAAAAEARVDHEHEVSNDEFRRLFIPYLETLGPSARMAMGAVRPDRPPPMTCEVVSELYVPLLAMPPERMEVLVHAMNQSAVEQFTRHQLKAAHDSSDGLP